MNKTLLLVICDFLLLNLLALTRWEKATPIQPHPQPPVPQMDANAAQSKEEDLVAAMQAALADERATREQLAQQLQQAQQNLSGREQSLAELQAERERLAAERSQLAGNLDAAQQSAQQLAQRVAAAQEEASMTKEQLAQLQRELDERRAEAERQRQAMAKLEEQNRAAQERIEGLSVSVKVAEQEKQMLQKNAEALQTQVVAEREERQRVQATATQLAQGVGQLAEKSGELTQEIRTNRPINANTLFSDFLANRVQTTFTAVRPGVFGPATRERQSATVFVRGGDGQVYAILHIDDTPFPLTENSYNWDTIQVSFNKPPSYRSEAAEIDFLAIDPRVVAIPVGQAQAEAVGAKIYQLASEPFKFPEAVLVSGGGKGYGEVGFKLDPTQPGFVRVDNRFFKRLFGDFAPSRGDLVLSKTGELLGIMVNRDYCVLLGDFTPVQTLKTGDVKDRRTGALLNSLYARVRSLPLKLQ